MPSKQMERAVEPLSFEKVGEKLRRLRYRIGRTYGTQERLRGKIAAERSRSKKLWFLNQLAKAETLHKVLEGRAGTLERRVGETGKPSVLPVGREIQKTRLNQFLSSPRFREKLLEGKVKEKVDWRERPGILKLRGDLKGIVPIGKHMEVYDEKELAERMKIAGPNSELILRAKRGDEEAKEKLLKIYDPFFHQISKKFFVEGMDDEDLHQEGLAAISDAIKDYEFERAIVARDVDGVARKDDDFGNLVSMKIHNRIVSLVRASTQISRKPKEASIALDDEENKAVAESLADDWGQPERETLNRLDVEKLHELARQELSPLEMVMFEAMREQSSLPFRKEEISRGLRVKAAKLAGGPLSQKQWENGVWRVRRKLEKFKELFH